MFSLVKLTTFVTITFGAIAAVSAAADGRGRGSATQQGVGAGQVPLGAKSMLNRLAHTRHPH